MKDTIRNRLEKNQKKLAPWATRLGIEAYRLYDRDIPEVPFIIERYGNDYVVWDRRDEEKDKNKPDFLPVIVEILNESFQATNVFIKHRKRQEGKDQYEKLSGRSHRITVKEGPAKFFVNLTDYLDTGLYLDHRPMRELIRKDANQKNVLNLFSYTGSVSVFAALGGGTTTSVDMSNTYIQWSKENFQLNDIPVEKHEFIQEDATDFLINTRRRQHWDIIFLDPPTYSRSKRMYHDFEVERDHRVVIENAMKLLKPGGQLYFSNNKRSFHLDESLSEKFHVQDITKATIPTDFRDQKIHRVYKISTSRPDRSL